MELLKKDLFLLYSNRKMKNLEFTESRNWKKLAQDMISPKFIKIIQLTYSY